LKHVRPVITFDAAHLKSKWLGTLYAATVKTGTREIYPIAFAIIKGNEDGLGWRFFCEHLKAACSMITIPHPVSRPYRFFTIISDRDKGLKEAIANYFPENHACHCAVHLQRNVCTLFGARASKRICSIAQTFSKRMSRQWLQELEDTSPAARNYIDTVEPSQWRSTEWLDTPNLPPRYGICTTNMSESMNNMLVAARDVSWLESIDLILSKVISRTCELRAYTKASKVL
jgi:transposase-like protein